jgi:sortase A
VRPASPGGGGTATVAVPPVRTKSRRRLRAAGTTLAVVGAGLLAWIGVVALWADPFTGLYALLQQRRLADRYEQEAKGHAHRLGDLPLALAARRYRLSLHAGDPFGRIRVGRLGLDAVVVEGASSASLRRGPGRDLRSLAPGEGGLVYVAGHRTTYGAPFGDLDQLRRGDPIRVEVPYATYRYAVTRSRVVRANDLSVLRPRGREELALQACHPRFFASHRLVVYARPVAVARPAPRARSSTPVASSR